MNADSGEPPEANDHKWSLRVAYRKLWAWLLQWEGVYVSVPPGPSSPSTSGPDSSGLSAGAECVRALDSYAAANGIPFWSPTQAATQETKGGPMSHGRHRGGTGPGDHPAETDHDVFPRSPGMRNVRGAEAGNASTSLPSEVRTSPLPTLQGRAGGDWSTTASGPEEGVDSPTASPVPKLVQCPERKLPSSVERCNLYLVEEMGWMICVKHGAIGEIV